MTTVAERSLWRCYGPDIGNGIVAIHSIDGLIATVRGRANASRVVACVNYCEDVSTAEIEAAPSDLNLRVLLDHIDKYDTLLAHREALALIALAAGFMPESNHAMFVDAANALLGKKR